MLKTYILLSLFLLFQYSFGQNYNDKKIYKNLGDWVHIIENNDMIKLQSIVTKQELIDDNFNYPKYRYEIRMKSNSNLNGKLVGVWISNMKIYIDGIEMTRPQFSDGMGVKVTTTYTTIYSYQSDDKIINIEINWDSVNFLK